MNPKYQQVVLHFGAPKTGTTTLQHTFGKFQNILLDKKVLAYPPGDGFKHGRFASYFCDKPEQHIYNKARGLSDRKLIRAKDQQAFTVLSDWIEQTLPCQTLLFSYEGFPSLGEATMQKMKSYCETLAKVVKVILYIRPPLSHAVSAMSQKVWSGRSSWQNGCPQWSYQRTIEKCIKVFGKNQVLLRVFSPQTLIDGDILVDFAQLIDLPADVKEQLPRQQFKNRSLSFAGLKVGDIIIEHIQNETQRNEKLTHAQFKRLFGNFLKAIPGEKIKLTSDQINEVMKASQQARDYLEKTFQIVFNEDIEKYRIASSSSKKEEELVLAISTLLLNFSNHIHGENGVRDH